MAKEDAKPDDQQNKHSHTREVTRSSQQSSLARRSGPLPLAVISPSDFFRINPFSLMRRMTEEMDRIFGDITSERQNVGEAFWTPPVEVSEQNGNYVIRAELAGLKPEDVKLEIENDAVVMQGERKCEREEEKGGVHRTEIRYGNFYRSIPLPEGAKVDQAHARFENGVLEITVPVPEQQRNRRQIPIQTSAASSASAA